MSTVWLLEWVPAQVSGLQDGYRKRQLVPQIKQGAFYVYKY